MWKKQQSFSNFNTPNTASGLIQAFVITSDPQYPWTDCTDGSNFSSCNIQNISPCSGRPESDSNKNQRSEALIREQYNDINNYINNLPSNVNAAVLINGDMTAFGHGTEWSKIKNLINTLNRPYYYGVGNHDIENNFNDCANNGCFKNSLNELISHVQNRNIPSSQFDHKSESHWSGWGNGTNHHGSFAYSFDIGNINFIQLQHNPTMERKATPTITNTNQYHIYPNRNWLENQLRRARDTGKIIIVNVHVKGNIPNDYAQLLQNYGVTAVFSGHYHTSLGTNGSVGNIPAFISGSASQRTYLILEQFLDRLDIYTVRCNGWRNHRQLVRTIPLSMELPIFSGRYKIVTALNNSSVVNMDPNNCNNFNICNVNLWQNSDVSQQLWDFRYDSSKQAYQISTPARNFNNALAWNAPNPATDRDVIVAPFHSNYDEHYWVIERGNSGFIFRNKRNPNLVMDVQDARTANGTNIKVNQLHPTTSVFRSAQEFHLRKMN
ncbi:metallophosphoesterase [Bacillus thuringiensis]|uniref:Ricin B lectin domain-containing protein n=1 Tax=Bacillus thuringiensis subsp. higo TaxID=132266 RepID=A0A9X6LU75_BACUH|nr:metallophosphoesterase [Bacillus thuringiensis]OUB55610.1 hypothetical protein BK716_07490 [Bacillus thuringiensis serovar higo]